MKFCINYTRRNSFSFHSKHSHGISRITIMGISHRQLSANLLTLKSIYSRYIVYVPTTEVLAIENRYKIIGTAFGVEENLSWEQKQMIY